MPRPVLDQRAGNEFSGVTSRAVASGEPGVTSAITNKVVVGAIDVIFRDFATRYERGDSSPLAPLVSNPAFVPSQPRLE